MAFDVAIQQWRAGEDRLAAAPAEHRLALERVTRAIHDELRRRLGGTFTVDELAELYDQGTGVVPGPRLRHSPRRAVRLGRPGGGRRGVRPLRPRGRRLRRRPADRPRRLIASAGQVAAGASRWQAQPRPISRKPSLA